MIRPVARVAAISDPAPQAVAAARIRRGPAASLALADNLEPAQLSTMVPIAPERSVLLRYDAARWKAAIIVAGIVDATASASSIPALLELLREHPGFGPAALVRIRERARDLSGEPTRQWLA